MREFIVEAPEELEIVKCLDDYEVGACSDTETIEDEFDAWIGRISASVGATGGEEIGLSGGCSAYVVTHSGYVHPDECGSSGSVITFTVTDRCGVTAECTALFTVIPPDEVVLTVPDTESYASCEQQSEIDAAYAAWLGTAEVSGGCEPVLSHDGPTSAPDICAEAV